MPRKFNRNYSLSVGVLYIATLAAAQFQPVQTYSAGVGSGWAGAIAIAVADVNGDGKPDILVGGAANNSAAIGVLLGNGDGTFQPAQTYNIGSGTIRSIAVADVNGDGMPDLIVAQGDVVVLLGNGDGTFQSPQSYPTGTANWVVVADVNGDHVPDLLVAGVACSRNVDGAGVLLGNGDGTFGEVQAYCSWWASYSTSIAVADVNGDGKPDLVVDYENSPGRGGHGVAWIALGNGDGTFRNAGTYRTGGFNGGSITLADVNGDGKPDIVAANICGNFNGQNNSCAYSTVGVLLNNGDGTFKKAKGFTAIGGWQAVAVAVQDVNGDGFPDLLVANECDNSQCDTGSVGLMLGKGNGSFGRASSFSSGSASGGISIATADVNGDGVPDVFVANAYDPNYPGASVGVMLSYPGASKTVVTTSASPSWVGQSVTFTAKVTSVFRVIPDGELVTFYDGATAIASVPLAGGTATYTTSSLSAKTHTIKAKYSGDTASLPSQGKVLQVVQKYPTTTSLTSSPNPSNFGQTVTFTAAVTPSGPYAVSGKVKFWDGTTGMGSATLNGGVATLKKSTLGKSAENPGTDGTLPDLFHTARIPRIPLFRAAVFSSSRRPTLRAERSVRATRFKLEARGWPTPLLRLPHPSRCSRRVIPSVLKCPHDRGCPTLRGVRRVGFPTACISGF